MQKKILFVDDEKTILVTLEALFQNQGYETCSSMNGLEALEMLKFENVPVCFLDLRMPEINGIELCREIKKLAPATMIFGLSAFVDAYTPEECKEAGFEAMFGKPFKIDALLDAARGAFEKLAASDAG